MEPPGSNRLYLHVIEQFDANLWLKDVINQDRINLLLQLLIWLLNSLVWSLYLGFVDSQSELPFLTRSTAINEVGMSSKDRVPRTCSNVEHHLVLKAGDEGRLVNICLIVAFKLEVHMSCFSKPLSFIKTSHLRLNLPSKVKSKLPIPSLAKREDVALLSETQGMVLTTSHLDYEMRNLACLRDHRKLDTKWLEEHILALQMSNRLCDAVVTQKRDLLRLI